MLLFTFKFIVNENKTVIFRPFQVFRNVTLQRNWFFWSNSYKIEVVITSLIEMSELPNFVHMTISAI